MIRALALLAFCCATSAAYAAEYPIDQAIAGRCFTMTKTEPMRSGSTWEIAPCPSALRQYTIPPDGCYLVRLRRDEAIEYLHTMPCPDKK